jgi:hypothetical protein
MFSRRISLRERDDREITQRNERETEKDKREREREKRK